jgi:succinate dehydrogenase/fumarate reductase flavoprotein subunit
MKESPIHVIDSDVLIIGSGIAGLRAALEVTRQGKRPLLISKSVIGKSNNTTRSGGAFTCSTPQWSPDNHLRETLEAGRMLNDRSLVEMLITHAPPRIQELVDMGLFATGRKTGVSFRRSTMIGGPEITSTLTRRCLEVGIQTKERVLVTDLIVSDGRCHGALGFDKRTGEAYGFHSGAVLLATGGAGAIYSQHDNVPGAVGDGYVLAMRAGLELMDMEFAQFYPLVFAGSRNRNMILPAAFADIGIIRNRFGEDLKMKYNLHKKPVAILSRDKLSQAFFREIVQGNGVDEAMLLDMRGSEERLIDLGGLTTESRELFRRKFSYDSKPIMIAPASHFTMGGIPIDRFGRTALGGLFAAGEVAGGIHGANRMGGNALSEGLVFGVIGARSAVEYADSESRSGDFQDLCQSAAHKRFSPLKGESQTSSHVPLLMKELRDILWKTVGIVRNKISLKQGLEKIDDILDRLSTQRSVIPGDLYRIMECTSAALTSRAVAVSALERTESRGAHFRDDFPEENDQWLKHVQVKMVGEVPRVSRIIPVPDVEE